MKSFLDKKWIGPIIVLLYALVCSLFFTYNYTPNLKEFIIKANKEIQNFLPITVHNGEITEPKDTIITKTFSDKNESFTITLNTKSDTLDILTLPDGIYISKKCVYTIVGTKKEVQCFVPSYPPEPTVITSESIQKITSNINTFINFFLAGTIIIIAYIIMYIIILFYTALIHWIIALFYKTHFSQTLFINTLICALLTLFETTKLLKFNFFITITLCIVINFIISKNVNEKKQKRNKHTNNINNLEN